MVEILQLIVLLEIILGMCCKSMSISESNEDKKEKQLYVDFKKSSSTDFEY